MSISERTLMPERARRIEVFTGAGRRRTWPTDEKAAIVAESYAPGRTVCGVARRHGLTPAQLFTWRRLARRVRLPVQELPVQELPVQELPVQELPVRFVPAVVEALPGLPPRPASQLRRARRPGPVMGIEVEMDVSVASENGSEELRVAPVCRARSLARIPQMRPRCGDLKAGISVILQGSSRHQWGWRWTVQRVKKAMPPSGSRSIPA